MKRTICAIAMVLMAGPLWAADFGAAWVRQLRLDGYDDIEVSNTWLGRTRIQAGKGDIKREIILNRATGEVLRDYSQGGDGGFRLPLGWEDKSDKPEEPAESEKGEPEEPEGSDKGEADD